MHSEHAVEYSIMPTPYHFQMDTRSGICLLKASDQYICCGDVGGQVRTHFWCVCVCVCVGACVHVRVCVCVCVVCGCGVSLMVGCLLL